MQTVHICFCYNPITAIFKTINPIKTGSMAYSPLPSDYEPEHRYQFEVNNPAGVHVVLSGNISTRGELPGQEDEENFNIHEVHMLVGPWWTALRSVVPSVYVNGFENKAADVDDEQGWKIRDLTWDTVGGTGANIDEERIRLKFTLLVKGEESFIRHIGYNLMASGRYLGHKGLNSPGPVHENE